MPSFRTSLISAAIIPSLSAVAQPEVHIATMVPENAWLVAEFHDLDGSWDRFKGTSMGSILEMPAVRELIEELTEEGLDEAREQLDLLGINLDEAAIPEGFAGAALIADIPEDWSTTDDDLSSVISALFVIDFGEQIEFYGDAIETALETGEEDGGITLDYEDYGEIEIVTITQVIDDADLEPIEYDFDDDGVIDDVYIPEPDEPTVLHLAIDEGVLMVATSMDTIRNGIDGHQGELPDALADSDLFNQTRSLSGTGEDMFFFANIDAVWDFVRIAADNDESGDGQITLAVLDALGPITARSIGTTIGIDTPAGELEQEGIVLISEMRGLWSLLGTNTGSWRPGPVVASDASTAGRFVFETAGLFPLARQVMAELPEEMRAEMAMPLAMAEGTAGPVLAGLDEQIEFAQRIVRPYSSESQRAGMSISVQDADPLLGILNAFAPQIGLQPRAFAGGQIFDADTPFFTLSVGVGADRFVMGDVNSVERTLRAAGDEATSLADDPRFRSATSWFKPGAFSDTYSRSDESIRYAIWTMANASKLEREQLLAMGWSQEEVDQWVDDEEPEWADRIDIDEIAERVGDSAFQAHVVPEGIHFRSITVRPAD